MFPVQLPLSWSFRPFVRSSPLLGVRLARLVLAVMALAALLLPAGCASVSRLRPVVGPERDQARQVLQQMLDRPTVCGVGVDAQATVALHSFLRNVTLSGYLQAMAPASVRFVGLGPLDQAVVLFATDGQDFRLILVPETTGYEGSVAGATFAKYAPPGMRPESLYYWLIGAVEPGDLQLTAVRAAEDGKGYWFDLRRGDASATHRMLLDVATGRVVAHLLLDENDSVLLSARYDRLPEAPCCLPAGLVMEAPSHSVTMTFSFADCNSDREFTPADFQLTIPPVYRKVAVP